MGAVEPAAPRNWGDQSREKGYSTWADSMSASIVL
jgi:hypothetical protein